MRVGKCGNNRIGNGRISRFLAVLLLISSCLVFQAPDVFSATPEYIKVGLVYGSSGPVSCTVEGDSGLQLGTITGGGFEAGLPLPAYTKVTIGIEDGHVTVEDQDGVRLSSDIGVEGCIMPYDYKSGGLIKYNGTAYRGGLHFKVSGGRLTVVNYLTIEEYLYGVIHNEMSQGSPLESLKAQAVAARSYAYLQIGSHSASGFDVCTNTHCQVYKGYASEYPKTTQAVDETAGLALYSQGSVVAGFYSKNSGGHTQNSEDVWATAEPYLRGVEDIYSPDYPWTLELTLTQVKSKLDAAGHNTGAISSIEITKTSDSGSVMELTVTGASNTVVLKKEAIRTVFGVSEMKSLMFTIGTAGSTGSSSSGSGLAVGGQGGRREAGSSVYVINGSGEVNNVDTKGMTVQGSGKSVTFSGRAAGSSGTGFGTSASGQGAVSFVGKGYGHGIGMAQDSAIEMGNQGKNFKEILHFFYTDIEIK